MTTVDDLAYFYLDLLETLDLRDVVLVGVSFGGWLAAEIAVKSTERISHLVLADASASRSADARAGTSSTYSPPSRAKSMPSPTTTRSRPRSMRRPCPTTMRW